MIRRTLAAVVLTLGLAGSALAAQPPTASVRDGAGSLPTELAPGKNPAQRSGAEVQRLFLADGKVADWLERYPRAGRSTDATYSAGDGTWTVHVWWGEAGEIARGRVDDDTKAVLEAWTGPQVAWTMARGYDAAFGGEELNNPVVWIVLSLVFLLGLADLRRPRSLRNLDLLVLLSFGVSLAFFNRGDVFTAMPLVYPPLVYLIARMAWIGFRGRRGASARPLWPIWLLAGVTVFLVGFRIGFNVETSDVIDVGYAGVIGAQRIAAGEAPYGHMPVESEELKPCGPPDAEGAIRERIQTNGRCESANEGGDTYGPVSYQAYLPGYWLFGWPGRWDDLPAAHFTSIAWDLLVLLGLLLVGRRFGGWRLGVTLAFAWAAYPFTQYVSNSNTNDAIMPAFLVWGFWLVSSPVARGTAVALAGWTKLAAVILAPLWGAYPDSYGRPRAKAVFVCAFTLATLAAFWILLLEPSPFQAAREFWERTFVTQFERGSPFSLWDWEQYHARGIPNLERVQQVLIGVVALAGVVFAFVPRQKSPLQLAALTAALLLGFELVLTHWFYLYIPWFLPFVVFAVLAPAARPLETTPAAVVRRFRLPERRRAVAVGLGAVALLLVSWALLHQGFWARSVITDVPGYENAGEAIARGEIPYRDFAVEYPPAALAAFAIPTFGEGSEGYRRVFEALMWLCGAAMLACMLVALIALRRRLAASATALAFAALAPLLLGSVVLSRFDLLPAALSVAALAALLTSRTRLGCAALGVGAAVKVYPLVLLPLALVYVWKRSGRREALVCAAAGVGTLAALVLPFAVIAPGGVWDALSFHATRGLQIESLGSALLLAAHHVAGAGVTVGSSSGSQNLGGAGADALAVLHTVVQVAVVAGLWIAFWRGPADRERLVRYAAATVCAFVALGKVLSPQFVMWLLPLVPLVGGRRGVAASALLGVAALLTQLWFPFRYWDLVNELDGVVSSLVLVRDLVLLAIVAVLVAPVRERVRRRAAEAEPTLEPAATGA